VRPERDSVVVDTVSSAQDVQAGPQLACNLI
jgi:hypothetical protein